LHGFIFCIIVSIFVLSKMLIFSYGKFLMLVVFVFLQNCGDAALFWPPNAMMLFHIACGTG